MGPLLFLIVAVVVISVVVGAIAQFLNKLNEVAAPPPRGNGPRPAGPPGAGKDMDRFLAEIDRLRRKAAAEAAGDQPPPRPAAPPKAQPVAPSAEGTRDKGRGSDQERKRERDRERNPDRSKGRATPPRAEPAPPPVSKKRIEQPAAPLAAPVAPGTLSPGSRVEDLPVAPVVTGPAGSTGAPSATRVTRIADRARPVAKTDFAKNLTAILGSGQGAAMAVVMSEIFGPPKSKRPRG